MSHKIVRQPNGLFALYSDEMYTFVETNLTEESMIAVLRFYRIQGRTPEEESRQLKNDVSRVQSVIKYPTQSYQWSELIEVVRKVHGNEDAEYYVRLDKEFRP